MKIGPHSFAFLACLACSLALAADVDTQTPQTTPAPPDAAKPADATPPAPPPKYKGFVFTALGDGYFTFNFNHPASGSNQLQNFNLNYGQPELNLAKITIDK
ncbi:MAG: porin, partial [Acidobacteriota bacterium]|nr:porin [Acidobacteriota bacterium]